MLSNHVRAAVATRLTPVVALALLISSCGGAHQAVTPALPGSPFAFQTGGEGSPALVVTINVVVTVPVNAPGTQSISISVNGGRATIANLTSGSPGCSGSPLVCTIPIGAKTGLDVFAFKTFSGTGGSGNVVAQGDVFQKISPGSSVHIALAGTPSAIVLALKRVDPRECDPATDIALYVMVMDSAANVIIGGYGETVMLSDSDTSGKTTLSVSSLSDSSTSVSVHYVGFPLKSATFSASAAGVSSVTAAILKPQQMLYVTSTQTITVYPSNANGNVTPVRTIAGSNTGLGQFNGVALDNSCDLDVAVYNTNAVLVFSAGSNGNVSPIRTISGANTLIANPQGIAVDAAGNTYVANTGATDILEFASNANGNVSPIKNIGGSNTGLSNNTDVAIGPKGKIYVANANGPNVLVYSANANGNVAPTAAITNSTLPFNSPRGIEVDTSGKVYVSDFGNTSFSVFSANANGSSAPLQEVVGGNTMMSGPIGISVDYAGEVGVTNYFATAQSAFAKGANGNVAPKRTISGANTGLAAPFGNAI